MLVSDHTTINDIEHEMVRRGFFPSHDQNISYISMTGSRSCNIAHSDTMRDLLTSLLSHFHIHYQCALNPDGTLKDASEIEIFNDPDNTTPITSGSWTSGHSHDKARMTEIIDAEHDTTDNPKAAKKCKRRKAKKQEAKSDEDNDDFVGSASKSESASGSEESDSDEITLEEVNGL
ncbi:hypothetical protein H0H81_007997 [Sphagnurus paluster]|uniref:Uncharacterized protein n=1 Tax=Sphagnurus paluster TaxID=117069 RepID=A0A9P7FSG3_9AGAR|nr:hypothetical protein H0H81_007997 [Sphagnurus paluster]